MEYDITSDTKKGPRPYQEDRSLSLVSPNGKSVLLVVMDGHGGEDVAEFCIHEIQHAWEFPVGKTSVMVGDALKALVRHLHQKTKDYASGSTFSAVHICRSPYQATCAVLGDSPICIYDVAGKVHVGPEHNVRTNLKERQRVVASGGYYSGGYAFAPGSDCGLQMSRALGDRILDGVIGRVPQIFTVKQPVWAAVMSDGVCDPSHRGELSIIPAMKVFGKQKANARDLIEWAQERGLEDNATAVVWNRTDR